MGLRDLWDWGKDRIRENRSNKEIERDLRRLELLSREKNAEQDARHSDDIARLRTERTLRDLSPEGRTAAEIIERLKQLDAEEAGARDGVTDSYLLAQIKRVYTAKKELAIRGKF